MSESIGLAVNFYREPNTLPGLLELSSRFFDDMLFISAPPSGAKPDDESIEILKKWGAKILYSNIDDGFGTLRSLCIHKSSTEWVMIMDCDERFFPNLPVLECHGTGRYPEDHNPDLSVGIAEPSYNQGQLLRDVIKNETKNADAIRTVRRHWMDWGMHRPCQDWNAYPDWQLRIMRNRPYIGYRTDKKMHEAALDTRTNKDPIYATANERRGPFHDHFHVPAKLMEPDQRQEDIRIYDALDQNKPLPVE